MSVESTTIDDLLIAKFPNNRFSRCIFDAKENIYTLEVEPSILKECVRFMKEDKTLNCVMLTDLCGIHYPDNEFQRQFAVAYLLHNWIKNVRIRIKTFLNGDKPEIDTVSDIFASANWMERETYDFFGIKFIGHPNLKRILNAESLTSYPMRKEYPLEDAGRTDKDDRFFGRTTNNYQVK